MVSFRFPICYRVHEPARFDGSSQSSTSYTGPFKVSEYIQDKIRKDPSDIPGVCEIPSMLNVDENVWQYEHIRQFLLELNLLVVHLSGACTSESCSEMKANGDWLYKCASHDVPQEVSFPLPHPQCSAIDYMIHTLEHSTRIVNDQSKFKNRMKIPASSTKHLFSIMRRIYRFFTHCYFNHRTIFVDFENETNQCARFTFFSKTNNMMDSALYIIPEEVIKI